MYIYSSHTYDTKSRQHTFIYVHIYRHTSITHTTAAAAHFSNGLYTLLPYPFDIKLMNITLGEFFHTFIFVLNINTHLYSIKSTVAHLKKSD